MGPHQDSVEGKENLPRPAGHTLLDAPQDHITAQQLQGHGSTCHPTVGVGRRGRHGEEQA